MESAKEPKVTETWECPRCLQSHCGSCVEQYTVDFNVMDAKEGYNQKEIEWEGLIVCPWCYNQLLIRGSKRT